MRRIRKAGGFVAAFVFSISITGILLLAYGRRSEATFMSIRLYDVLQLGVSSCLGILIAYAIRKSLDQEGRRRDTVLIAVDSTVEATRELGPLAQRYFANPDEQSLQSITGATSSVAQYLTVIKALVGDAQLNLNVKSYDFACKCFIDFKQLATRYTPAELRVMSAPRTQLAAKHTSLVLAVFRLKLNLCD